LRSRARVGAPPPRSAAATRARCTHAHTLHTPSPVVAHRSRARALRAPSSSHSRRLAGAQKRARAPLCRGPVLRLAHGRRVHGARRELGVAGRNRELARPVGCGTGYAGRLHVRRPCPRLPILPRYNATRAHAPDRRPVQDPARDASNPLLRRASWEEVRQAEVDAEAKAKATTSKTTVEASRTSWVMEES